MGRASSQHGSEVGAQRAGLHDGPRSCRRATPSTQCAFGLGRSQDNLRVDEVDAPVIADQG